MLRMSRFVVQADLEGEYIGLMNTLTDSCIALRKPQAEALLVGDLAGFGEEELALLKSDMFLIEDTANEMELFRFWLNQSKYGTRDTFSVTLLTTHDCNLSCQYCHHAAGRGGVYMSESTAQAAAAWAQTLLNAKPVRSFNVTYYGGEPLLNMDAIYVFSNAMAAFCSEHRIAFTSAAVTNGTLLTPTSIDKLSALGITALQITLDGPADIHNVRRPYSDGAPSFERVMAGLRCASARMNVALNVVVDDQNSERVAELLDYLKREGILEHVRLFFSPTVRSKVMGHGCEVYIDNFKSLEQLWHKAKEFGQNSAGWRRIGPCGAISTSSLVVDARGLLFTCPAFVDAPELSVGCVFDQHFREAYASSCECNPWDNPVCICCGVLPYCVGGCREQARIAGDWKGLDCRKEEIHDNLKAMMRYRLSEVLETG